MQRNMLRNGLYGALLIGLTAGLSACGGGSGSASLTSPPPMSGTMPLMISDASSDDWATIGVKLLSIALVPQGGGSAVTVWTAPSPAPYVNLEQLDQLGEILGNVSVPVGTYSGAVLTISANPGDLLLTVAADPESGFPIAAGTSIASDQINIQGMQGSSGNFTVPVSITFDSPLTVSTSQNNALDLEFDLAHPAFIVGHTPPAAAGATLWAVNFNGPVRHHPVRDITRLLLRHTYGTVTGVTSGGELTITKDFPVLPASNPETAIATMQSLDIAADGTNGTIVYDVDNPGAPGTVVKSFSSGTVPTNDYVRIAARYQQDGTLTAVRVWYSSSFNNVWLSPEGHVLRVDSATARIWVTSEAGVGVPVSVNASTEFYFHDGATPIATGTGLLSAQEIVRNFKVHVTPVDALAVPMVAKSIDIETAAYGGAISNASTSGLTYTARFRTALEGYSVNLGYIASTTANTDPVGNPIMGFDWWDFTFPTLSSTDLTQFVAATNGGVNFGGTVGALTAYGASATLWGDGGTVNTSGWYLRDAVLLPTPVPLGAVTMAFAGNSFAMTVLGGTMPATVDVSTTAQSATLVYQVDRSNGIITISPIDVTTSSGLAAITAGLVAGTPVKVFGVPQAGSLKAYVLVYFTGMLPAL
jgi:hypothetical protein